MGGGVTSAASPSTPSVVRDQLLEVARAVVTRAQRAQSEPGHVGDLVIGAWRSVHPGVVVDAAFRPDPGSGVEALAFAVAAEGGAPAGGMLLRLRDDYPDSFEAVDLGADGSPGTTAAVWAAFFAGRR